MDDTQNPQADEQMVSDTNQVVTEGEIVEQPAANQSEVLLSLEELIKNHIASLDRLSSELKKHREMFDDSFQNNLTYKEHTDRVKEATKARGSVHEQIMKQAAVRDLAQKIKDFRIEIKEKQLALSDYLQEYQRMTGANEIEGPDGQLREIVNSAKLVKKSSKPQ